VVASNGSRIEVHINVEVLIISESHEILAGLLEWECVEIVENFLTSRTLPLHEFISDSATANRIR
jgi:hypothetical protein